jgi:purine catabolism regulator
MAVTVQDIVAIAGMPLRLLAGEAHTGRPIRWVHVSELEDPTPWLKGGELILTTGLGIGGTPAKHRAYVKRLADAGLTGLGFGLGFTHDRTPRSLITAAEQAGFPLFEVPYPVPFIAITEGMGAVARPARPADREHRAGCDPARRARLGGASHPAT